MPNIKISADKRENAIVDALEGGSNYWYWLGDDAHLEIEKILGPKFKREPLSIRLWKAIEAGASIPIQDRESLDNDYDNGTVLGYISLKSIEEGENIMADKHACHFADFYSEEGDAITADVWFQLAVMKEVIYG